MARYVQCDSKAVKMEDTASSAVRILKCGRNSSGAEKHVRKFIVEITGYAHLFHAIHTFARRLLFVGYRGVFAPLLKMRFCKERREDTIFLDNGMIPMADHEPRSYWL